MKGLFLVLGLCLALAGCRDGGGYWSGTLSADYPISVLGTDGGVALEIPQGAELEAALYMEADRSFILNLRDRELGRSAHIRVPLPKGNFQYGRTYEVKDFGQNFSLFVRPRLQEKTMQSSSRYESCSEYMYHCGWQWKEGEYTHVCEHQTVNGTRKIDYQNVEEQEVLEADVIGHNSQRLGDIYLTRSLGVTEKVSRRYDCEPYM